MLAGILINSEGGGTFLTWTIYYLSGRNHYYDVRLNSVVELTDNPLMKSDRNAHKFQANAPRGLDEFNKCYDRMHGRDDLNVMYLFQKNLYSEDEIIERLRTFDRILYVDLTPDYLRYFVKYETRVPGRRLTDSNSTYKDWDEQHYDFLDTFFSDGLKKFGSIDAPWDHREFLALNLDKTSREVLSGLYDRTRFDHLYVNNIDIWTRLDQTITDIFNYLGLSIDQSRMEGWIKVYNQWKTFHYDRINFCIYFPTIIDSIVRGIDMDLTRFNLDIVQEAALLRELMGTHGLNLRAHGLEKFTNARDLHALLEPNIHKLTY